MDRYYIGLASTFHDPAIAILSPQGEVVFAEAAERQLQDKRAFNCAPDHVDRSAELIREYCDPSAEFVLAMTWRRWPRWIEAFLNLGGFLAPEAMASATLDRYFYFLHQASAQKLAGVNFAHALMRDFGKAQCSFRYYRHHLTHAAAGCFSSPYEQAAVAVVDAFGERGYLSYLNWDRGRLSVVEHTRSNIISSLGLWYSRMTDLCGFDSVKGEEWKLMGLAPYGKLHPEAHELSRALWSVHGRRLGRLRRQRYRSYWAAMERFKRQPDTSPLTVADIAYTTQQIFSEVMAELLTGFHTTLPCDNLVLTGGCALNSSFVGKVVQRTPFARVHVPAAPADDGNALGAAFLAYQEDRPAGPPPKRQPSPYLGTPIDPEALARFVQNAPPDKVRHLPRDIHRATAELLAQGRLVGWVQGRAEFGPRALGNRSILADPRRLDLKTKLEANVKYREGFRPFAPAILDEFGPDYFEDYQHSPYMERTLNFRPEVRDQVPAVVHVNGTGRLQSVRREWNEGFYDLLLEFKQLTGVPILLNTSFNLVGKPIIHTVEDAVSVFYTTGLDALVVGDYLVEK